MVSGNGSLGGDRSNSLTMAHVSLSFHSSGSEVSGPLETLRGGACLLFLRIAACDAHDRCLQSCIHLYKTNHWL